MTWRPNGLLPPLLSLQSFDLLSFLSASLFLSRRVLLSLDESGVLVSCRNLGLEFLVSGQNLSAWCSLELWLSIFLYRVRSTWSLPSQKLHWSDTRPSKVWIFLSDGQVINHLSSWLCALSGNLVWLQLVFPVLELFTDRVNGSSWCCGLILILL